MDGKLTPNSNERIKALYEIRGYAEEQYDKLIVYLSSGALVLTVGFVKEIVNLSKTNNLFWLFFSWACFSSSLILNLVSHKTSLLTMNNEITNKKKVSDFWNRITECFNWLSLFAFIAGIISFMLFISIAFTTKGT
jgi:hypothetical protein